MRKPAVLHCCVLAEYSDTACSFGDLMYFTFKLRGDTGDGARNALRKVTFDLPDDSEGEEVEDILGGKAKNMPKPESKSSFEKRQEKVFNTFLV